MEKEAERVRECIGGRERELGLGYMVLVRCERDENQQLRCDRVFNKEALRSAITVTTLRFPIYRGL